MSFQRLKTWKQSIDPDFETKKHRILHLDGLMDGTDDDADGDPEAVISMDEFGPLNLQPHPGRQWAARGGGGVRPRRRRRATYTCPHGVRHLLAAYGLSRDRLYGHIKHRKRRGEFLVFLRYVRTLYPPGVRLGIVLDNVSPHLSIRTDRRVTWSAPRSIEEEQPLHEQGGLLVQEVVGRAPGDEALEGLHSARRGTTGSSTASTFVVTRVIVEAIEHRADVYRKR